jgi:release factor glutamine methyltransferase
VDSVEIEARWLLEAAAGRTQSELALHPEVDSSVEERALEYAQRRADGEPLQYVTGVAGFRRLTLAVGPGVFVPRPETELVAEKAMDRLPDGGTIVDVGTGSGAIALSVADERPDARVVATEISPAALEWVHKNRAALDSNVQIIEADLIDGLPEELKGRVDVIVSNPPYVADKQLNVLPADIVDHEPHVALFGGHEGMDATERLVADAKDWLRPGGWLVLEMGVAQAELVAGLLERHDYKDITVGVDYADWPRVIQGRRP